MNSAIEAYFKTYRLGAFLVSDSPTIRYLTGFTGTNGLVLATPKKIFFFTDFRYFEQAEKQVRGATLVKADRDLYIAVANFIEDRGIKTVGFYSDLTHFNYERLQKNARSTRFKLILEEPALLRTIKTKAEIALLAKALAINNVAFQKIKKYIKPGVRESELAWQLEKALREAGAESLAFTTIVASGKRGALPHGVASDKKLQRGELVTIDFGGVYQGYHADETVTVLVDGNRLSSPARGEVVAQSDRRGGSPKQFEIHKIVLEAQAEAIKLVRPGAKCADLDKAARDYIVAHGYGNYFGHALGHGVGLEVHERPILSPRSQDVLREGMVFTIEPGIYIPGFGGVRIEDVFVCTKRGARRLTKINKQLRMVKLPNC